ncbi:MAG: hypothetical protein IPM94_07000 [bacterium]|nr:hypothetical protein [bacterium]
MPLAVAASFSLDHRVTNADLTPPTVVSRSNPGERRQHCHRHQLLPDDLQRAHRQQLRLSPTMISGRLMSLFTSMDNPGVWSENNTVITVGLRTPLDPRFRSSAWSSCPSPTSTATSTTTASPAAGDRRRHGAVLPRGRRLIPVPLAGYYGETDNTK